jgi:hypothetical protein
MALSPRKSWQKRHVPHCFRAKTTEAACEALKLAAQPQAPGRVYAERSCGVRWPRSGQLRPASRHRPRPSVAQKRPASAGSSHRPRPSGRPAPRAGRGGQLPRRVSHPLEACGGWRASGIIVAGQGVIGVITRDKGRRIVVESSLPLLHRLLQLWSLRDFAGQFGAEGAFDKLAEDPPLV